MAFFVKPQSSAVKIVKPTSTDESSKSSISNRKDSIQRQCRNIMIYGHCKYQDRGCLYYHPPTSDTTSPVSPPTSSPKLTASAPAFTPSSPLVGTPVKTPPLAAPAPSSVLAIAPVNRTESPMVSETPPPTITSQALNAPVFVPRTAAAAAVAASANARMAATSPPPQSIMTSSIEELSDLSIQPADREEVVGLTQETEVEQQQGQIHAVEQTELQHRRVYSDYSDYGFQQSAEGSHAMELSETSYYDSNQLEFNALGYDTDPMESSYYHQASIFLRQPLNYLLYTPTVPPELTRNDAESHFVPSSAELRQTLQEKSEAIRGIAPVGMTGVPEVLQGYHTLVHLEPSGPGVERRKMGNWYSTVYRAIKESDGMPYALRRIENFRLMQQAAFGPIEAWSQIQHPNIVAIREAFTTKSFDDNSLVMAYSYYPNAKTLYDTHIKPTLQQPPPLFPSSSFYPPRHMSRHHAQQQQQQQQRTQHIPEPTLWSYIIQIASAIKRVHDQGLAVRMVDVTKILVTGKNRIRLSSCGIFDVLLYDTQQDIDYLQREDLVMFGRVVLILCTGNVSAPNNQSQIQKALETIKKVYSLDVQAIAHFFCSKMLKKIDQVLEMVRGRIMAEHEEALMAVDRLEEEMTGELENARLVRLMAKFGFINERPEFARDPRWSETGDRYIIKLFRDYVFHQVDEQGNPLLDLTHVLTCLNKLDAGTDEKVMLVARDEQSCLVVSYKEIKTCVSSAFDELVRAKQVR